MNIIDLSILGSYKEIRNKLGKNPFDNFTAWRVGNSSRVEIPSETFEFVLRQGRTTSEHFTPASRNNLPTSCHWQFILRNNSKLLHQVAPKNYQVASTLQTRII